MEQPPSPPSTDLINAYLKDRDEPCPKCGYNLRNTVGGVCPECGTMARLAVERPGLPRLLPRLAGFVLIGVLGLSIHQGIFYVQFIPMRYWIAGMAIGVLNILWCVTWLIAAYRRRGQGERAGRTLTIGAVGLGALQVVTSVAWWVISRVSSM